VSVDDDFDFNISLIDDLKLNISPAIWLAVGKYCRL